MRLHPPSSTLFPYTTLFRSNPNLQNIPVRVDLGRKIRGAFIPEEGWWFVDRKSTRLNSSHMSISYAVFCLKKKKSKLLRDRRGGPRLRATRPSNAVDQISGQ